MAIVPKRKTSKQRKRKRNSHSALQMQTYVMCKNCGENIDQHRACKYCGFYKGKQVLQVKNSK